MDFVIFYNKTNTTSNGNSTVRPLRPSRLGDCRWAGKMIIIKIGVYEGQRLELENSRMLLPLYFQMMKKLNQFSASCHLLYR